MVRSNRFVSTMLIAMVLIVPVVAQEDKKVTSGTPKADSILQTIYDEDQKNRNDVDADAKRREQVRQLIKNGKVQSGRDYYYAAFIFQHGQKPDDYLYAHVLAVTAVNKGLHEATWLSAASLDRYLQSIKQPQIFGTQFGSLSSGNDDQEPYNRDIVSDDLRALWCVASQSVQAKIQTDLRAGKEFSSTRTCPLPEQQR